MNMTKKYISVVIVAVIVYSALVFAEANTVYEGNVGGYTSVGKEGVDQTYNAGYSMYSAAWPLLREYPGHSFQSGLFGTWMHPHHDKPAPAGIKLYSDIEGGLGWWRDTEYPTETPKFIMGGVELNFRGWANGPGAGQGRDWSKVTIGDGSTVTYYWYRFADQPALLNADLTDKEREILQKRVEKLHRHWPKDRDYLAPPTVGKLADIDPALIVTPPKGMEEGYVPIATRQAME